MSIVNEIKEAVKGANPKNIISGAIEKLIDGADKFIRTKDEKDAFIVKLIELNNEDVQNARSNETLRDTSENSGWLSKNVHELIALSVSAMWGLSIYLPAVVPHGDVKDVVMLVFGYLFGKSMPNSK